MKVETFALGLALLLAPLICSAQYSYVSYNDLKTDLKPSSFVIDVNKKRLVIGHTWRSINLCDHSSGFECVSSPGTFEFAVKKGSLKVGQSWDVKGRDYSVIGVDTIRILGLSSKCYLIRSKGDQTIFYYSTERGLLAFRAKSHAGDGFDLFISTTPYGFPNSPAI